ncbi:MAG: hypothetical protein M1503_10435 [Thaumarchaeota archaeon]|nr:hypothetical protein [Nitrososphaerota archaeon]MCL5318657.1 hypothetical protein [Nitrososphaerota archaeon]
MADNEKSEKDSAVHEKIEERMRSMQDSVDNTLLEIQNLISGIENPFTLLGKMAKDLGKEKVIKTKIVDKEHEEQQTQINISPSPEASHPDKHNLHAQEKPIPPLIPVPSPPPLQSNRDSEQLDTEEYSNRNPEEDMLTDPTQSGEVRPPRRINPQHLGDERVNLQSSTAQQRLHGQPESYMLSAEILRFMDTIALSEFLLTLFGRDNLYDILLFYLEIGMADEDSVKLILKAIDLLTKNAKSESPKRQRPVDSDDIITAIYLIEVFSKDSSGLLYLLFRHLDLWDDKIDGGTYDDMEDLR